MDCRSKVVSSSLTINVTVIAQATIQLEQHPSNRHGAEEARGAHNSEVTRSKRVAGNLSFGRFTEAGGGAHHVPLRPILIKEGCGEPRVPASSWTLNGVDTETIACIQSQHNITPTMSPP